MADHRHDQVALDGTVAPALEVVETQQPLFILKASFDVPAREGHMQHAFDRRGGRGVGDEVFDLAGQRARGKTRTGRAATGSPGTTPMPIPSCTRTSIWWPLRRRSHRTPRGTAGTRVGGRPWWKRSGNSWPHSGHIAYQPAITTWHCGHLPLLTPEAIILYCAGLAIGAWKSWHD